MCIVTIYIYLCSYFFGQHFVLNAKYYTILFVILKIYFIYKVAGKKIQKGYIKLNYVVCLSDTGPSCHMTVMGSLIVLVNKRAD
jgi:hypothetical protein